MRSTVLPCSIAAWTIHLRQSCVVHGARKTRASRKVRQLTTSTNQPRYLPDTPARTRFAPSPTGSLHLGSIRTALFNYLLAQRTGGQFLLRIEDTDQKRTVPGAEDDIKRDLRWAGLQWEEGPEMGGPHGPYRQSGRTAIYSSWIVPLISSKKAYRCFCSADRLDALNRDRHARGLSTGYDRKCAHLSQDESEERACQGEKFVIRLNSPEKYPTWQDIVYGNTGKAQTSGHSLNDGMVYDDTILIKSDGYPTYHFANVVDDHLMQITHVIRGAEWMASTPLHLTLYQALGWSPPVFGHVPLLVDKHHQKLSKRHLDTDIATFRDKQGIFPDVLTNFAVLLGWSHRQKSDYLPLSRLKEIFDLKFTKGSTVVTPEKLDFLQQRYARRYISEGGKPFQTMVEDVTLALSEIDNKKQPSAVLQGRKIDTLVAMALQADAQSYTSATEFARRIVGFFKPPAPERVYEALDPEIPLSTIQTMAATLLLVPHESWTASVHRANFYAISFPSRIMNEDAKSKNMSKSWKKEYYRFLRWALVGGASGPSLPDMMEILGRDICVARIQQAIKKSRGQEQGAALNSSNVQTLSGIA